MADKVETATPRPKWAGIDDGLLEKQYHGGVYSVEDGCLMFEVPPEFREEIITAVNSYDSNLATIQSQRETIEVMREGIGKAIRLIHSDEAEGGNYDQGMRLLCQLIGRDDGWPTDVRTVTIQEVARRANTKENT